MYSPTGVAIVGKPVDLGESGIPTWYSYMMFIDWRIGNSVEAEDTIVF